MGLKGEIVIVCDGCGAKLTTSVNNKLVFDLSEFITALRKTCWRVFQRKEHVVVKCCTCVSKGR